VTQSNQWVEGPMSQRESSPGHEADKSPPPNAEINPSCLSKFQAVTQTAANSSPKRYNYFFIFILQKLLPISSQVIFSTYDRNTHRHLLCKEKNYEIYKKCRKTVLITGA